MKQRWSPSITTSRSDCSVSRCRERCVRRDATNCMKFTQFSFQLLPCPFWQKPAGRVGFPASKFHVRQTSCISTSSTFVGLIFICLNSIFQCQLAQNYHFGLLYPCAKKPLFTDIAESILWGAICKEHRSRELLQDSKRSLYTDPRVRISYKDSAWGRLNTP